MGSISKEKIEKFQLSYKNKIEKDANNNDGFHKEQNSKLNIAKNNYNLIFKKLFKSTQLRKNNNPNYSMNVIKTRTTGVELEIKNNEESAISEINYIIFRNHKSFDLGHNSNKDNFYKKNNKNNEIETTSITSATNENTNLIIENKSVKDDISINSDYLDISQSILLSKNKNNYLRKEVYGNETIIRNSYYYNLIIKNVWNPSLKEKICNTLFIFDWDDTLFCTSFLIPILNSTINKENIKTIKKKLVNLDENVSKLLKHTLEKGLVFIITNASPGWVEYSSSNFLPLTEKILKNIKIISAKSLYSKIYPGDPRQWKIKAFEYAIESNNINKKILSNIISFGDSYIDLEAIENLKYLFNNAFIKIIKFKENPHPVQLEKQIFIIDSQLDFIIKKVKNFTLKIYKKKCD